MTSDDTSTPRSLRSGEVLLDRYVVGGRVAEGGMAVIRQAEDRRSGRTVALKVLYPHYGENEVVRTRFVNEGRIQGYLDHPNIIDVYDIAERPTLAIVMEYIDGPTLEEYLERKGPLDTQDVLDVMLPVLSAIGFAHSEGVIHRDIKPSNILLDPTDEGLVPKVMDFGVAKVERGQELTDAGTTVGTLHYMSPEQILGEIDIDGRADIYSLGVTIYKLCTGDVPFNASTEFTLMMAQVEAPPTPPSELRAEVSEGLEAVIMKALEKEPDGRYQTVRELTAALLELRNPGASYAETETDTAPIPRELIEYAMRADEIAVDRTGELPISAVERAADMLEQEEKDDPEATVELAAEHIEARVAGDRRLSEARGNRSNLRETIEEESVDSAKTQPFERRETTTRDELRAPTGQAPSKPRSLSQETTRPFKKEEIEGPTGAGKPKARAQHEEADEEKRSPEQRRAAAVGAALLLAIAMLLVVVGALVL